jgi:uncharacterized Zn finger protein
MSYGDWKPYVPVAKRREKALKTAMKEKKAGKTLSPVIIEGRKIAKTFWGTAWCDNLESYSDYKNRLPRGRTYVRNGSIIDLVIGPGKVSAQVMGSSLYTIKIVIAPVSELHWKALVKECTGSISSLVELLQGKFSKSVMEHICQPKTGLFPAPKNITLDCSCPDWAVMCKHVAAVLYGIGARLDDMPELLFTLRQVDAGDLVTQAAELPDKATKAPARGKVLEDDLLADVFGIEMDEVAHPAPEKKTPARRAKPPEKAAERTKPESTKPTKKKTMIGTEKKSSALKPKK